MPRREPLNDRLSIFGAKAAAHPDVDELLTMACQEVAAAVGVSHVKALEYIPEEKQLLVRAGIGWRPGVVGQARLPAALDSAAGFTLQTGVPTIANDLETEVRFHIPKLLRDHDVKSAVNVLIKSDDYVFGVLEADSVEPNHFAETDIDILQGFANVLALVVVQNRYAQEKHELSQKLELLLKELTHRTKNNNQMLLSIITLQKRKSKILEVTNALDDVINRIMILNSIDEFINAVTDTEKIDAAAYIGAIAGKVFSTLSDSTSRVRIVTDFQDGTLQRDQAQGLALVVNEFIVNSFKYAFKDGGTLSVKMRFEDTDAQLELADDGPGIPDAATPGLGMQIIDAISEQLGGEAEWLKARGKGARLRVRLPRGSAPNATPAASS